MGKGYYLWWVFLLLLVECSIAYFIKGGIIRHFVGDVLAVVLLYCIIRLISPLRMFKAALISLIIGFAIELAQAVELLNMLNLQDVKLLNIVLGATADPWDLLAYILGFVAIIIAESTVKKRLQNNSY